MEVGTADSPSSAGSGRGGGDREDAARGSGGGGAAMRARVCARVRTPQGVGVLLLVGGAIVGAAVVAWRRRGDRKRAKNHPRGKEEEKVLDGGAVENGQGKFDNSDESLSREDAEVEANGLDGDKAEEIQANVDEIVADELDTEPADKFEPSSSRECTEIIDDTGRGDIKNAGQNSMNGGIENEITPHATEDVENSDESTSTTISRPDIADGEHKRRDDGTDQETTTTQITAVTQMTAHQPQISDELKADKVTETATLSNVSEHDEQKQPEIDPVAPVDSPACSSLPSLVKTAQKKRPNPGENKTGMKLGQDCGNTELSKGGAAQGVAMVTMNRRAASMAILAIIFALTIGVNVVVRFYSTLRAT